MNYEPVRHLPVAKFFYKGTHTHPIRRTILVIESTSRWIRGYELREGNITREFKDAPIKTYSRVRIAKNRQVNHRRKVGSQTSTLKRLKLLEVIRQGV